MLSLNNLARLRNSPPPSAKRARRRVQWKLFLPFLMVMATVMGVVALPPQEPEAETSVVIIPDSMYLTIPQTIGLVPSNVDPAPLLSSLMATAEMQARIKKAYQALCRQRSIDPLPSSAYTLQFIPQSDQVTLSIRVKGDDPLAIQLLADTAAKTTLAVYQERMERFIPQLRHQLSTALAQARQAAARHNNILLQAHRNERLKRQQALLAHGVSTPLQQLLHHAQWEYQKQLSAQRSLSRKLHVARLQDAVLRDHLTEDPSLQSLAQELRQAEERALSLSGRLGPNHPQYLAVQEYLAKTRQAWRHRYQDLLAKSSSGFVEASLPGSLSAAQAYPKIAPVSFRKLALASANLEAQRVKVQVLRDHLKRVVLPTHSSPGAAASIEGYRAEKERAWAEERVATLEHQLDVLELFQTSRKTLAHIKDPVTLKERLSWDRVWILSCIILVFSLSLPLLLRKPTGLDSLMPFTPEVDFPLEASPPAEPIEAVWDAPSPAEGTLSVEPEPVATEPESVQEEIEEAPSPEGFEALGAVLHHFPQNLPEPAAFLKGMQQDPKVIEAFQQLHTELDLPRSIKVLAVTEEPRVAAGLAMVMAQPGASVCVIDCHVTEPTLHTLFDVGNDWGLAELLQAPNQIGQILKNALDKNPLVVFTAGKFYQVKLSDFEEFPTLMADISADVSHVILNLPPLVEAEEVERLLALSGAQGLLVCGAAFESPELITALSEQLPIPWIRLIQI